MSVTTLPLQPSARVSHAGHLGQAFVRRLFSFFDLVAELLGSSCIAVDERGGGGWQWRLRGLLSEAGGAYWPFATASCPFPPLAAVPIGLSPPNALDVPAMPILTSLHSFPSEGGYTRGGGGGPVGWRVLCHTTRAQGQGVGEPCRWSLGDAPRPRRLRSARGAGQTIETRNPAKLVVPMGDTGNGTHDDAAPDLPDAAPPLSVSATRLPVRLRREFDRALCIG